MLTALALGSLIGLTLALTGAGGGILAVPALTLGLGWTMIEAAPLALLTVAIAALIGIINAMRRGYVRIRAALLISVVGILATPLGLYLSHRLPETGLRLLFAAVMLIVATRLWLVSRGKLPTTQRAKSCVINTRTGRIVWTLESFLKLGLIGLLSGTATGLLGVGGGFIVVPALIRCSNISMNGIISTSLAVIALISSGAVISSYSSGKLLINETSELFIAGAIIGMLLGRLFAEKLPAARLQQGFAILVVSVALSMVYKTLI